MHAYVEAVDGGRVLKFNNFLVEEEEMILFSMVLRTPYMCLLALLVRDMHQTGGKLLLILARLEPPNFLIPIKEGGYLMASC